MQSVSSKIWTRVAVFISYDDNHYTTGTSSLHTINCTQFKLSNISIRFIDRTGTTTPDQSGPESNSNEGVLHIPQNSKTGALPSDGLMSCSGHLLRESDPSAETQLV